MELLNTSLDKFYKFVTGSLLQSIPEEILGRITLATVKALSYLKEKLKIIHRGENAVRMDAFGAIEIICKSSSVKLLPFSIGCRGQLLRSTAFYLPLQM